MNVSFFTAAAPSLNPKLPGTTGVNPKIDIPKFGKREEFNEFLAELEKRGQGLNPFNPENINLDQALLKFEGMGNKNFKNENLETEKFLKIKNEINEMPDKEFEILSKTPDALKKLESNELFLFQRELANKLGGKNEALHSFSKIYNMEKTNKKPDSLEPIENLENLTSNNKELQGLIKANQPSEQDLKFNSPKELFNWISQVIGQNKIKVGETLNLQIRDNNLGEFNIAAQTGPKDGAVNMSIIAQSKESDEFFKSNEKELLKSLEKAGVKIGKIEIMTAQDSKAAGDSNRDTGKEYLGNMVDDHFSQKEQLDRDGKRRQEIWRRWQDSKES